MDENTSFDDSDDDSLPPLNIPYLPTESSRKSHCMSINDLLMDTMCLPDDHKTNYELDQNIQPEVEDNVSVTSPLNRDVESIPESPRQDIAEIDIKFFWANDYLEYFNLQDITLQNCGYSLYTTDMTTFENLLVSSQSVALENEISTILSIFDYFSNFRICCKQIKPFTYYLFKIMSIHEEESTVLMCENVLKNIIIGHFDDVKFSISEILMVLFNYGVVIQNWEIFKMLPELKLESSNTRKGISRIPCNWLYNLESTLNVIEELILTSSFSNEDLLQIILYFLWMGLDSSIQNEYLVTSKIRKCVATALEVISEEVWLNSFETIFNFVMSIEQSSMNFKWDIIYQIVKMISPVSKRGVLLQKVISIMSLRKLLGHAVNEQISLMDENYTVVDLQLILESICIMETDIEIAVKFLDICISHLKLSCKEHHAELCNSLKKCENSLSSRYVSTFKEQELLVRIHSRIMLMSPDSMSEMEVQIRNIKREPDAYNSESLSEVLDEKIILTSESSAAVQKIEISESFSIKVEQENQATNESNQISGKCLEPISDVINQELSTSPSLLPGSLDQLKKTDIIFNETLPIVKLTRTELSDVNDESNAYGILNHESELENNMNCNILNNEKKSLCTVKSNNSIQMDNDNLPVTKLKKSNFLYYIELSSSSDDDKSTSLADNINEIENDDSNVMKNYSNLPNIDFTNSDPVVIIPCESKTKKIHMEQNNDFIKSDVPFVDSDVTMKNAGNTSSSSRSHTTAQINNRSNQNVAVSLSESQKRKSIISSTKQKNSELFINNNQSTETCKSSEEILRHGDKSRIINYKGVNAKIDGGSSKLSSDREILLPKVDASHMLEDRYNNKNFVPLDCRGSSNSLNILNSIPKSDLFDPKLDINAGHSINLPNFSTFQNSDRKSERCFKTTKFSVSCSITEQLSDDTEKINVPLGQVAEINPSLLITPISQSNLVISSGIEINPSYSSPDIHVTFSTETPNQVVSTSICKNDLVQTEKVFNKSVATESNLSLVKDLKRKDTKQNEISPDVFIVNLRDNSPNYNEIIVLSESGNEEDDDIQIIDSLPLKRIINCDSKNLSSKRAKLLDCQPSVSSNYPPVKQKSTALPILESCPKNKRTITNSYNSNNSGIPSLFNFGVTLPAKQKSTNKNKKGPLPKKNVIPKKSSNPSNVLNNGGDSDVEIIYVAESNDCRIIQNPDEITILDD